MTVDIRCVRTLKDGQRLFSLPRAVPARVFAGFSFDGTAARADGQRSSFRQRAIVTGAVKREGQGLTLCCRLLSGHVETKKKHAPR